MPHPGIDDLDLGKLNPYSRRMAELLIPAFPDETLHSVMHSEDYWMPQGDRFIGAWVAKWLQPAREESWSLMVSSEETMLTVRWLGDHQHFANWDRLEGDPELQAAKSLLSDIFAEKAWFVSPENSGYGRILYPDEIDTYIAEKAPEFYTTESWRGTHNATKRV